MSILHAKTEQEILEHVGGDKLIVLNFWASWCGPCQMFANVLNEVDEEIGDRVQVIKVNVDEAQDLAAGFGVQGIPHSRLIIGDAMSQPLTGYIPFEQLKAVLEQQLN